MKTPKSAGLKVIRLTAENVQKLTAIELHPNGETIVLGGENGAGKSTVLNSLWYALGGKDAQPPVPLRTGADRGFVELDLGEIIVRRTFTPGGGGTLTVKSPEGAVYPSPQAILDKLADALSFDPLAFKRMSGKEHLALLRKLTGLDFSALDAKRAEIYQERTAAGRELKQLEGQLAGMPEVEAPAEGVSVAELTAQLLAGQKLARANEEVRRQAQESEREVGIAASSVRAAAERVAELREELEQAELAEEKWRLAHTAKLEKLETAKRAAAAIVDPDLAPIEEALRGAEEVNRRVRAAAERSRVAAQVEAKREEVSTFYASLAKLDAEKEAQIASAPFPVEGLGFGEDGVLLNGLPFEQASSTEQLMVSLAMGAALNPKLRVLLIRDASLLTPKNRAKLLAWCKAEDFQGWIELAGTGPECSVVIEDGAVREGEGAVDG